MLLVYDGCVRCLVDFYSWTKKKVKLFKGFLLYAIIISMLVGSIGSEKELNNFNKDFFLLYRFTYLAHLCLTVSLYNSIECEEEGEDDNNFNNDLEN